MLIINENIRKYFKLRISKINNFKCKKIKSDFYLFQNLICGESGEWRGEGEGEGWE